MNAADAFDIGSFDEDDVKGIKVRLGKLDKLTHVCLVWLRAVMKCKHILKDPSKSTPFSIPPKLLILHS